MINGELSFTDVLVIHELLLMRFGGMRGVTEQGYGKLEAAMAAPNISMFGEEMYPDVLDKAAVLFFRLARSHGFSDGNKRVALVALLIVLQEHGLHLAVSDEELYTFTLGVADTWTQEQVMSWIATHTQSLPTL